MSKDAFARTRQSGTMEEMLKTNMLSRSDSRASSGLARGRTFDCLDLENQEFAFGTPSITGAAYFRQYETELEEFRGTNSPMATCVDPVSNPGISPNNLAGSPSKNSMQV